MATATENGHRTDRPIAIDTPDNPLHRLTPEQIEEIGREFDELHQWVKCDLGERDARYIRSITFSGILLASNITSAGYIATPK